MGDLKKVGNDFADLLGQRLRAEVTVKGKTLLVREAANGKQIGIKDLKLQVKHVLHHMHLSDDYRVLAEHQKIRIVRVEERTRRAGKRRECTGSSTELAVLFPWLE